MLRTKDDLRVKIGDQIKKLEDYKGKNTVFDAEIISWQKKYHIEIKTEKGSTWFLVMPLTMSKGASRYEKRFSIEKCFQDQKSSGFNIEKSKIRKEELISAFSGSDTKFVETVSRKLSQS